VDENLQEENAGGGGKGKKRHHCNMPVMGNTAKIERKIREGGHGGKGYTKEIQKGRSNGGLWIGEKLEAGARVNLMCQDQGCGTQRSTVWNRGKEVKHCQVARYMGRKFKNQKGWERGSKNA